VSYIAFLASKRQEYLPLTLKDQDFDNPQIQLIKGTLTMKNEVRISNQTTLLSVQSLSQVDIQQATFANTWGMKGPQIFSD
jgi:hypothetical protein